MKIFDSSNPRVAATSALGVVTITQNAQGTPDPLVINVSNLVRIIPNVPKFGQLNQLNPALTPNTITFNGVTAGDTLTIQGVVFTAVNSGAVGAQFNVGGGDTAAGVSLATQIGTVFKTGPGAWFRSTDQTVAFGITVYEVTGSLSVAATASIESSFDGVNATPLNGLTNPAFSNINGTGLKSTMTANVGGVAFLRSNVSALTGTGAIVVINMHGINSKST